MSPGPHFDWHKTCHQWHMSSVRYRATEILSFWLVNQQVCHWFLSFDIVKKACVRLSNSIGIHFFVRSRSWTRLLPKNCAIMYVTWWEYVWPCMITWLTFWGHEVKGHGSITTFNPDNLENATLCCRQYFSLWSELILGLSIFNSFSHKLKSCRNIRRTWQSRSVKWIVEI